MTAITALNLTNFRSHAAFAAADLPGGFLVLTGANGAGKTNLLEAISLLCPGRGLRHAKAQDLPRHGTTTWSVHAEIESWTGAITIGTGGDAAETKRRRIRLNGADVRVQSDLGQYIQCVWLTPQMDGLFMDGGSERRRFFDRLVFAFDPAHAGRVNRYDQALSERSKILKGAVGTIDRRWLDSLEHTLAETALAIGAARVQTAQRLQSALGELCATTSQFPLSHIQLRGDVETRLQDGAPALAIEDALRAGFAAARAQDAETGGSSIGAGRTDIMLHYAAKNVPAAQASTGEQKALLTGLVLAHAVRFRDEKGFAPIILFDEVTAHFDANRRAALFDVLRGLDTQVWLTGTDAGAFADLKDAKNIPL